MTEVMNAQFEVKKECCLACAKVVYPMDRISADDKVFHKSCLRCEHCNKILSLGNYAALNSIYVFKYRQILLQTALQTIIRS